MKLLIVSVLVFFLAGCGFTPEKQTITVEKIIYPELPSVPELPSLELNDCRPDRPRIWWQPKVVKNEAECTRKFRENPEITENLLFQRNCMEHAIDTNSNIVIGFDKEGQQCFVLNREKIRMQIKRYQERIDAINEQREEWKLRNKSIRAN